MKPKSAKRALKKTCAVRDGRKVVHCGLNAADHLRLDRVRYLVSINSLTLPSNTVIIRAAVKEYLDMLEQKLGQVAA